MMDEAKSVGGSYRPAFGTGSLLTPGTALGGKKLPLVEHIEERPARAGTGSKLCLL